MRANQNELSILRALLTEGESSIYYRDKDSKDGRKIQAAINIVKDTNAAGYCLARFKDEDIIRLYCLHEFGPKRNLNTLAQLKHYLHN